MSRPLLDGTLHRQGLPLLLGALLLAAVAAWYATGLPAHGVYWDEYLQRHYGQSILNWYASGFSDTSYLQIGNLRLYGGLVEMTMEGAVRVLPGDAHLIRHALVACFALGTLVGTWGLTTMLGGRWLGLLAMALLAVSPRFIGHGFVNSKDIPTAAFYVWTVILFARDVGRPVGAPVRNVVPAGILLGLLLGTRFGSAIVLLPVLLAYALRWWKGGRGHQAFVALAGRFAAAFLIGWTVMLIGWPWAVERPLVRPLVGLMVSSRFPWNYPQLFGGRFVDSLELPVSYVPTWFALILPEVTLAGVGMAVGWATTRILQRRPWAPEVFLGVMAGLVPLVYVIAAGAALYDEVRHLLFLQPFIALAAAWGLLETIRALAGWRRSAAVVTVLATGAGVILPVVDLVRLAPYEYVYFNRISGGLPAAAGRYELDYWGLSYREGVDRLDELGAASGALLASCSHPGTTAPFAVGRYEFVGSLVFGIEAEPEYLLFTAPHDCFRDPEAAEPFPVEGERAPLVTRDGVTLLHGMRVEEMGPLPPPY